MGAEERRVGVRGRDESMLEYQSGRRGVIILLPGEGLEYQGGRRGGSSTREEGLEYQGGRRG